MEECFSGPDEYFQGSNSEGGCCLEGGSVELSEALDCFLTSAISAVPGDRQFHHHPHPPPTNEVCGLRDLFFRGKGRVVGVLGERFVCKRCWKAAFYNGLKMDCLGPHKLEPVVTHTSVPSLTFCPGEGSNILTFKRSP